MDVLSMLIGLVQSLGSVPLVGKVLMYVVIFSGVAASLASAVVALWHGAVLFLQALSIIPGLSSLKKVADWFSAEESKIGDFEQGKLLPILNRLSAIPLPKK